MVRAAVDAHFMYVQSDASSQVVDGDGKGESRLGHLVELGNIGAKHSPNSLGDKGVLRREVPPFPATGGV